MKEIEEILAFVNNKHKGQVDKAGKPYIFHLKEVAMNVPAYCPNGTITGLLHDILEDTDTTPQELLDFGIDPEIVEAVIILTRKDNEDYMDYIKKVAENSLARNVKISDLKHNMQMDRIPNPTEKDYKRLKKYEKAYDYLLEYDRTINKYNKF